MMIHAYNELYLSDCQNLLANMFDYALNDYELSPDWFMKLFTYSHISKEIETGNPSIISGKSGIEVAFDLIKEVDEEASFIKPKERFSRSPEYWAGYSLAYYQWYSAKRFKDIFNRISLSEIISMYKLFHEMDIMRFCEEMDRRYDSIILESKLKKIRESRGYSQNTLSKVSGVSLRSIQLYEQKVNDIDKAQAQTLYKLSRVLGCNIEDLLENPENIK